MYSTDTWQNTSTVYKSDTIHTVGDGSILDNSGSDMRDSLDMLVGQGHTYNCPTCLCLGQPLVSQLAALYDSSSSSNMVASVH